eukprot:g17631.t1
MYRLGALSSGGRMQRAAVFRQLLSAKASPCLTASPCSGLPLLQRRFLGGEGRSKKTRVANKKRSKRQKRKGNGPMWSPLAPIDFLTFKASPTATLQEAFPCRDLEELMVGAGGAQASFAQIEGLPAEASEQRQ